MNRTSLALAGTIAFIAGLTILSALPGLGQPEPSQSLSPEERAFLTKHWRRPLAPQGKPPAEFSPVEQSLDPADCGSCHPVQFGDWKTSLHARSMGPGIAGQLIEMVKTDPAGARSCLGCHAPLAEQATHVPGPSGLVANPNLDPRLRAQGVVCAACHIREHRRFGPPRRGAAPPAAVPAPHLGFTASTAFLRSAFCASCHQFAQGGFALNGKLLENTFEEWRQSPAARRGEQCQDCHMPDRRHLWRGIHDPEMVRSGVRIVLATDRPTYRPGNRLRAILTIETPGVGHSFPTYVTPRVVARAELLDGADDPLPGTMEEHSIGREVPVDLSREIADTRIPAGGQLRLTYSRPLDRPGLSLRVTVTVFPDHFYTEFFEALLAAGAGAGAADIKRALEETRRSPFVLFSRRLPLT